MASNTTFLPFYALLLLLLFSTFNAIPISRTRNLMGQELLKDHKVLGNLHLENVDESWDIPRSVTERMNLEVNDYPGSGANNRHTPRP